MRILILPVPCPVDMGTTMAEQAARAAEERATIQMELDDLKSTVGVFSGQAARLTGQAAEAKMEARRLPRLSASSSRQLAGVLST